MTKASLLTLSAEPDQLVPDAVICREFSITTMTLWRWSRDAGLQFPSAIQIRGRNFRSRRQLEQWKSMMLRRAIAERGEVVA